METHAATRLKDLQSSRLGRTKPPNDCFISKIVVCCIYLVFIVVAAAGVVVAVVVAAAVVAVVVVVVVVVVVAAAVVVVVGLPKIPSTVFGTKAISFRTASSGLGLLAAERSLSSARKTRVGLLVYSTITAPRDDNASWGKLLKFGMVRFREAMKKLPEANRLKLP